MADPATNAAAVGAGAAGTQGKGKGGEGKGGEKKGKPEGERPREGANPNKMTKKERVAAAKAKQAASGGGGGGGGQKQGKPDAGGKQGGGGGGKQGGGGGKQRGGSAGGGRRGLFSHLPEQSSASSNVLLGKEKGAVHPSAVRLGLQMANLAVGETVILLTLPLPLVGVSIDMARECQQNDSLADG